MTSSNRKSRSNRRRSNKKIPLFNTFKETAAKRTDLHAEAIMKFERNGPICSTEGAYQHRGECWNDAAYMLFLYTDGLKEITQEALLTGDLDIMAARSRHGARMKVYLEALRSRFVRHYLNQRYIEAQCALDVSSALRIPHGPHRAAGVNALTAAVAGAVQIAGKGYTEPESVTPESYIVGYNPHFIAQTLIELFDLNNILDLHGIDLTHPSLPMIDGTPIALLLAPANRSIHATCLYTCNGVDYFFDNELGVFQMRWRKLLTRGNRLVNIQIQQKIGDRIAVSGHWPAFFSGTKLYVPAMSGGHIHTMMWDGDLTKQKVWNIRDTTITYAIGSYIPVTSVFTLKGEYNTVVKAPPIVGRGIFRTEYIPNRSSSEKILKSAGESNSKPVHNSNL